jgi:2-polyprenyl-3-methyl-5-hydroxy-6-metoxy-1,4-benzoquinol methylase
VKVCLECEQRFESDSWRCPRCRHEPERGRFMLFAPEQADSNDGFDVDSFDLLARLEPTSFWFRSRNRLIVQLLGRHFPDAKNLLEIGCGTGYVLSGVHEAMPQLNLAGSELYTAGLGFASTRLPGATLYQMDCRHIPFEAEFDVVCAFDVLEHVEEDEVALAEMFNAVRPGGGIIVSVPQHKWLWNAGDDYAHHKRRYRRSELRAKLVAAGFDVVRMTSFVTLLLPVMALSRSRRRDLRTYDPKSEYQAPRAIDRAMESILEAERWLIRRGISLPAGGSLVAVARRRK